MSAEVEGLVGLGRILKVQRHALTEQQEAPAVRRCIELEHQLTSDVIPSADVQ